MYIFIYVFIFICKGLSSKAAFQKWLWVLFNCFLIFCVTHMILLISLLFSYTFRSYTFPFFSCYRVLYNLYLNPNLLKILSNYTYTIPKVTTLHTYILTSCLIFFYAFSLFLLFLHTFSSYFLTFPTHCLAVPKLILLNLLFHITILTVNITSCQATVPYFIWQLLISLVPLLNHCVIQPYCAITVPLSIIY